MMPTRQAATIRALLSPPLWGRGGTGHAGVCGFPPSHKAGGNGNSLPRSLLLATALLAAGTATASTQTRDDVIAAPVLRANVSVAGELVRIGDVIDNAGSFGKIAIYRAPELGTTGTLPTPQVLSVLRAHQGIGGDTRGLREISATRLARALQPP